MFKKSLAVLAVTAAFAAPAVQADSKNVDIYGVVAFGWMQTEAQEIFNGALGYEKHWEILNETRIGFRGSRQFKNMASKFIWQVESGFLGPNGLTGETYESGTLGTRDTFAGFEGSFGKFRFGRLLTPVGEALDWPYANGGVGPITETAKVLARWDDATGVRQSDQLRWDSPGGGMVTGSVSFGRGNRHSFATVVGDPGPDGSLGSTVGQNWFVVEDSTILSALANVKVGSALIQVGYETHDNDAVDGDSSSGMIIGFQTPIVGGLSAYGVLINGTREDGAGSEAERQNIQLALVYGTGDWIFKLTHAMGGDLEVDGDKVDDTDGDMTAVQALYILDPSAVAYLRLVQASDLENGLQMTWSNSSRILLGMEYYF